MSENIYKIFEALRFHHEDETVEFKKAENNFDLLGKYFSALSNEANLHHHEFAWLVFGVHDKTREIIGTSYKNSPVSLQKLKQDFSQQTTNNITFRNIHSIEIEGLPFLLTTTQVLYKIRNYPFKIYPRNSLIPTEGMKYDEESILESLHNCIAHQKYGQNARIIVMERENELEFINRGGFYNGKPEDYALGNKVPDDYRNPFLVQAMANIKMIDTEGFGIHKLYVKQKERYLPMPDYDKSDADHVVLTLPGTIIDEDYSLILLENTDRGLNDKKHKEQFDRYKKAISTIAFTDYLNIVLYENGEETMSACIGKVEDGKIVLNDDEQQIANFEKIMQRLGKAEPQPIRSASTLAEKMAVKAKLIASILQNAMEKNETTEDKDLLGKLKSF